MTVTCSEQRIVGATANLINDIPVLPIHELTLAEAAVIAWHSVGGAGEFSPMRTGGVFGEGAAFLTNSRTLLFNPSLLARGADDRTSLAYEITIGMESPGLRKRATWFSSTR